MLVNVIMRKNSSSPPNTYHVYFTGKLIPGFDLKTSATLLYKKLGMRPETIKKLLTAKDIFIKKNLQTRKQADDIVNKLLSCGLDCYTRSEFPEEEIAQTVKAATIEFSTSAGSAQQHMAENKIILNSQGKNNASLAEFLPNFAGVSILEIVVLIFVVVLIIPAFSTTIKDVLDYFCMRDLKSAALLSRKQFFGFLMYLFAGWAVGRAYNFIMNKICDFIASKRNMSIRSNLEGFSCISLGITCIITVGIVIYRAKTLFSMPIASELLLTFAFYISCIRGLSGCKDPLK